VTKQLLRRWHHPLTLAAVDEESRQFESLLTGAEAGEALAAAGEKRAADFSRFD
jgi:hypothetical protein